VSHPPILSSGVAAWPELGVEDGGGVWSEGEVDMSFNTSGRWGGREERKSRRRGMGRIGGTDEEEKESREVEGVGPGFISGLGGGGGQGDSKAKGV